jgi:hypothetical protein
LAAAGPFKYEFVHNSAGTFAGSTYFVLRVVATPPISVPIAFPPTYAVYVDASGTYPPATFVTPSGRFRFDVVPVPEGLLTLLIAPSRPFKRKRIDAANLCWVINWDASTFFG